MTNSLPRPDVIITHESDLDGLVSGVLLQRLAQKLFNTDVRLEAYNYHNWRQRDLREKSGWIADLTFEPRMDRPNWVIIDHHVTETPPKNAMFIHDLTKSAGLICYELCQQQGLGSPALDRLVHLSNVGDLFLEDDPDFILASDYANLVKIYQFWNLHALISGEIEQLLNNPLLRVMEVKRNIEDPLGFAWSRENVTEITPQVGFVDTVIGNNNLIVHQLLEQQATQVSCPADALPPRQRSGHRQPAQPQRRGAEGRREAPGRRPRQCQRRDPPPLGENHSRCRQLPAPGPQSEEGRALEQPGRHLRLP